MEQHSSDKRTPAGSTSSPNPQTLLSWLQEHLEGSNTHIGDVIGSVESLDDVEVHHLGGRGVLGFLGDYALCGWGKSDMPQAPQAAYRLLHDRLRRVGYTRHMVHPLNFSSVVLTRKLGAKPVGVDDDGFVHYVLTLEDFERSPAVNAENRKRRRDGQKE